MDSDCERRRPSRTPPVGSDSSPNTAPSTVSSRYKRRDEPARNQLIGLGEELRAQLDRAVGADGGRASGFSGYAVANEPSTSGGPLAGAVSGGSEGMPGWVKTLRSVPRESRWPRSATTPGPPRGAAPCGGWRRPSASSTGCRCRVVVTVNVQRVRDPLRAEPGPPQRDNALQQRQLRLVLDEGPPVAGGQRRLVSRPTHLAQFGFTEVSR